MALLYDIGDLNAVINRASFHVYQLFINSYIMGAVYPKNGSEVTIINFLILKILYKINFKFERKLQTKSYQLFIKILIKYQQIRKQQKLF